MTDIINIDSIELDLVEPDGTSHWIVTATIADAVLTIPARYHPAALASPDEYGPAVCVSAFQLESGETPPPVDGTQHDQIEYISNLDLDWDPIDYDKN